MLPQEGKSFLFFFIVIILPLRPKWSKNWRVDYKSDCLILCEIEKPAEKVCLFSHTSGS